MDGKRAAIIAGVGPGIGLAVARRFAGDGHPVALIARRREPLEAFAADIRADGGQAEAFPADLSDLAAVRRVIDDILAQMGPPAVLVWNGGRWLETPVLDIAPEAFEEELRLTVTGALVAAQAVAPAMEAAGGGTILFTGGGLALAPQYGAAVPALTAGKSALRGLVHASAPAFAARGIHLATVTVAGTVEPGTAFDPDRIAGTYAALHAEPAGAFTVERVFDGN